MPGEGIIPQGLARALVEFAAGPFQGAGNLVELARGGEAEAVLEQGSGQPQGGGKGYKCRGEKQQDEPVTQPMHG